MKIYVECMCSNACERVILGRYDGTEECMMKKVYQKVLMG